MFYDVGVQRSCDFVVMLHRYYEVQVCFFRFVKRLKLSLLILVIVNGA